jgi:hypothetical protein
MLTGAEVDALIARAATRLPSTRDVGSWGAVAAFRWRGAALRRDRARLAATSKCLAPGNNSRTAGETT